MSRNSKGRTRVLKPNDFLMGASLGVIALMTAAPAMAQDDLETVVVTGTMLKGINPPGTNIVTFNSADIKATGGITTSQILSNIPQLANTFNVDASTGVNLNPVGGDGTANRPKLRNLSGGGGAATLFLVNGHNMVGEGFNTTTPDGAEIPALVLQRVDVIADGGSALYGSDAVAGTVNFITRTSYEGLYGETHYGTTGNFDQFQLGVMGGHAWSSGSAYLAYEYRNQSPQYKIDRPYLRNNLIPLGGTIDNRSKACPVGANVTVGSTNYALQTSTVANTPGALAAAATGVPSGPTSSLASYNLCDTILYQTSFPQESMHSFFGSFNQRLADGYDFTMVAWFGRRVSTASAAPPTASNQIINNTNPFFQAIGTETQQTVSFSYQNYINSPNLKTWASLEQYQAEPELKVQLGGTWSADFLVNYGRSATECQGGPCGGSSVDTVTQVNALRYTGLTTTPQLGTYPLNVNNALDPYNLSLTNPTVLNQLTNWGLWALGLQQMEQFRAQVDGSLFTLPGGDIRMAAGMQYTYEDLTGRYIQGDNAQRFGPPSLGGIDNAESFHRYTMSVFGELYVPVFSASNELPFVHALNFDLSARFDHYSDFGGTTNPKIGFTYEPFVGLSVRGNTGTSFNAPSLADRSGAFSYVSESTTTSATRVPAVGSLYGPATNAEAVAAQNRPSFFFAGGTNGLVPQKANTWSFGFDYTPDFIDGLTVSLTRWHISLYHVINMTPYTSPAVLFTPAYSRYFQINPTLAQITAATTGANFINVFGVPLITAYQTPGVTPYIWVDARRYNLGNQFDTGWDFNIRFNMPTSWGSLETGFAGTDYTYIYLQAPDVAGVKQPKIDNISTNVSPYQISAFIGGQWGSLHGRISANYSAGFSLLPGSVVGQTHAGSFMPVNLSLDYDLDGAFSWTSGATASINVNNLFDVNPPFYNNTSGLNVSGPAVGGTVNGVTLGRLFSFGLTKRF